MVLCVLCVLRVLICLVYFLFNFSNHPWFATLSFTSTSMRSFDRDLLCDTNLIFKHVV